MKPIPRMRSTRRWIQDHFIAAQGGETQRSVQSQIADRDRRSSSVCGRLNIPSGVPAHHAPVIVNNADVALQVRLTLPCSRWYDGLHLRDALGAAPDTKVQAALRGFLPISSASKAWASPAACERCWRVHRW